MSGDAPPSVAASEVPVATAAQMTEVDRLASAEYGIALEALMENAAHQIARVVWPWLEDQIHRRDVVALAGSGNNGGDALAALRWLRGWGAGVRAILAARRDRLKPLARRQLETLVAAGVEILDASADHDAARAALTRCDLLIDGLLGFSASGAPRGVVAELIDMTDDTRATIVAVDLPSGLDADAGTAPGAIVHANLTVTLALPKPGLSERKHVGTLFLADIGIPPEVFARVGIYTRRAFARADLLR